VRNAQPREPMYRLAVGKGLYLQVMPIGARYWRLKCRFAGAAGMMGLGVYHGESGDRTRRARCCA